MYKCKNFLFIVLAFFAGSLVSLLTTVAFAHGGDASLIHTCIGTSPFNKGQIRIVSPTTNCNANETSLDWSKDGGNNGLPLTCPGCNFSSNAGTADYLKGKNLTGSYLATANFDGTDQTQTIFTNSILHATIFTNSKLINTNFTTANLSNAKFSDADLTGTNFTGSNLQQTRFINNDLRSATINNTNIDEASFNNCNLSGKDFATITLGRPFFQSQTDMTNTKFLGKTFDPEFAGANLSGADFTGATFINNGQIGKTLDHTNFTNTHFLPDGPISLGGATGQQTNFTGADLTNVDMRGVQFVSPNFTNANLTGVGIDQNSSFTTPIWSNTICPDGTNSNSNGNTCVGHGI